MSNRGTASSRRTASQNNTTAKKKNPTLDTNASNAADESSNPPTTTPTKPISVLPDNAWQFLEHQEILSEDANISVETIFDLLIKTSNDQNIAENVLRTSVMALVHVARQHLPQFIAFYTADLVGGRLKLIIEEEEARNKKVREDVERTRAETERARDELMEERTKMAAANAELRTEVQKWGEETRGLTSNLTNTMGEIKKSMEEIVDGMRMDNFYGGTPSGPQGAWRGGPTFTDQTAGLQDQQSYAHPTYHSTQPLATNEELERVKAAEVLHVQTREDLNLPKAVLIDRLMLGMGKNEKDGRCARNPGGAKQYGVSSLWEPPNPMRPGQSGPRTLFLPTARHETDYVEVRVGGWISMHTPKYHRLIDIWRRQRVYRPQRVSHLLRVIRTWLSG